MHYLFVHGSWHGQWCWDRLLPFFNRPTDSVITFDLPGSGERFAEIDEVNFEVLANAVEEKIISSPEPLSIVAHSFAGLIVSQLAEKYADKIINVFYLAAWLPEEGRSLVDMAVAFNNSELPSIFISSPNPLWSSIDPDGAKNIFYHDCLDADKQFAAMRIKPKNKIPDNTPMHRVNPEKSLSKSCYVLCTLDRVVNPVSQRIMATNYGFTNAQIIEFTSGHSPFLAKPKELADIIQKGDL